MHDKDLVEEATEVADVRSFQKLSLSPTKLMPAGSNMDTPLIKAASGNSQPRHLWHNRVTKGGKKCSTVKAAER